MKKTFKFIPLAIAPALLLMACANVTSNGNGGLFTGTYNPSNNNTSNGITEVTVTVDFNGGLYNGDPSHDFTVRKGTMYQYFKRSLPQEVGGTLVYADHTLDFYSLETGDSAEEISDTYKFDGDTTIHAIYTPVAPATTYTVTWLNNDGSTVLLKEENKYHKSELPSYSGTTPTPVNPTPGVTYAFDGWTTEIIPISADQTYVAKYKETIAEPTTITFDSQGGNPVPAVTLPAGSQLAKPNDPGRTGYTFAGWYLSGQPVSFPYTVPNEDVTLTAHWNPQQFGITFNPDGGTWGQGGTESITVQINYGAMPNPGDTLTKEGSVFTGWDPTLEPVTAVKTYTATWSSAPAPTTTYIISFDAAGGTPVAAEVVDAGSSIETKPVTSKTGYSTYDWYDGDNKVTFPYIPDANKTLVARWIADKVTITFNPNGGTWGQGGTDPKPVEVDYNTMPTPPDTLTRSGYTFTGWDTTLEPATATKTYTAQWVETVTYYTVSFDTQGGTSIAAQQIKSGEKAARPATPPTKTGWTFDDWYKDTTFATKWNFDTDTVTGHKTIYAHWIDGDNKRTITFDKQDGSASPTFTGEVRNGERLASPAVPTYSGHTFLGWYDASSEGNLFDFNTVFSAEILTSNKLYAHWSANNYTVTFDSQGGSVVAPVDVVFGGKVTKPANPTYPGRQFSAWFKEASCTTAWNFDTDTVTSNITLYAKWGALATNIVTFYDDDGTTKLYEVTTDYGAKVTRPEDPTKEGKVFAGWKTTKGGSTAFDFDTPITEAKSAYATYTDETYTIRWFNADANRSLLEKDTDVAKGTMPSYDSPTPTLAPDAFHRYTFKGWSPTILPVDADMSYYATYDYDDEIAFNYESDSYTLDGKYEFTTTVNYGGYIVYSFGQYDEADVDFIRNNLTVSIDGDEAKTIDDFAEGSIDVTWDEYGDRIARLVVKEAFGTDIDILNAHDIKVEVIKNA